MMPCAPDVSMEAFAVAKTRELLDSAVQAIGRAAESPDPEAVHKMRVAIRRLQQALLVFRDFLRKKGVKRIRREVKAIMKPAGELRNYDIALGLLKKSGQDAPEIRARRLAARQILLQVLAEKAEPRSEHAMGRRLGNRSA